MNFWRYGWSHAPGQLWLSKWRLEHLHILYLSTILPHTNCVTVTVFMLSRACKQTETVLLYSFYLRLDVFCFHWWTYWLDVLFIILHVTTGAGDIVDDMLYSRQFRKSLSLLAIMWITDESPLSLLHEDLHRDMRRKIIINEVWQ